MKKLIFVLMIVLSVSANETYKIDNTKSNSYFKAISDVFFLGNDEIVGINKALEGELKVSENNISGIVVINSSKFNTQNNKRDTHIIEILNYMEYPNIKFEINNETKSNDTIYLEGKLFINGVKKDIKFPVKKLVQNNTITYKGKISIKYEDFNISPPTFAGVIKQAKETIEVGAKIVFKKD